MENQPKTLESLSTEFGVLSETLSRIEDRMKSLERKLEPTLEREAAQKYLTKLTAGILTSIGVLVMIGEAIFWIFRHLKN